MTVTDTRLYEELDALGAEPETIARKLRKSGIRGKPGSPNSCPVAEYLITKFPGESVNVSSNIIVDGVNIPAPRAVAQFIRLFDSMRFLGLVQHRLTCNRRPRLTRTAQSSVVRCECSAVWREFPHPYWSTQDADRFAARARWASK